MIEFRNSDQMKAYMKKEAKRLNISVHNAYLTYLSKCILHRFSNEGNDNIFIKGSAAELAYLGDMVRAIVDIDIASSEDFSDMTNSVIDVLKDNSSDQFDIELSGPVKTTNTGIYKIGLNAQFGKILQPIGMDFQEKYDRLIEPQYRVIQPLFEGDEPFEIKVPSFEEYLAEKLCIIVESDKKDVLNTRVKDFYDIYQLHGGCYDYDKLSEYFDKMLKLRKKKKIEDVTTSQFNEQFIEEHKGLWQNTQRKYDFIDKDIDFPGAVYYVRAVIREQLQKNGIPLPDSKKVLVHKR